MALYFMLAEVSRGTDCRGGATCAPTVRGSLVVDGVRGYTLRCMFLRMDEVR